MANTKFLGRLSASSQPLLGDGGTGTMLNAKGFTFEQCLDSLNLTHPMAVVEIHRAYIEAGAQVVAICLRNVGRSALRIRQEKEKALSDRLYENTLLLLDRLDEEANTISPEMKEKYLEAVDIVAREQISEKALERENREGSRPTGEKKKFLTQKKRERGGRVKLPKSLQEIYGREEGMSKQKCKMCGQERVTSWTGAGYCDNCGFICSVCAKGRDKQCPICEKKTFKKI